MASVARKIRRTIERGVSDKCVADALRYFDGNVAAAATHLKVTPRTVYRRLESSVELRRLRLTLALENTR